MGLKKFKKAQAMDLDKNLSDYRFDIL